MPLLLLLLLLLLPSHRAFGGLGGPTEPTLPRRRLFRSSSLKAQPSSLLRTKTLRGSTTCVGGRLGVLSQCADHSPGHALTHCRRRHAAGQGAVHHHPGARGEFARCEGGRAGGGRAGRGWGWSCSCGVSRGGLGRLPETKRRQLRGVAGDQCASLRPRGCRPLDAPPRAWTGAARTVAPSIFCYALAESGWGINNSWMDGDRPAACRLGCGARAVMFCLTGPLLQWA